jgi:rSAM/selenodomain-associated transferase 1
MKKKELLIIFAKDPKKGKVKTRLAREIGSEKALSVYLRLLNKTCRIFRKTAYDVKLYFTPSKTHLKKVVPKRFELKPQRGNNLGKKMLNAFEKNKNKYGRIVIIGTDCPLVSKSLIKKAFNKLNDNQIVLGPSEDGGYYLVGLSKIHRGIFSGITWGTNKVLKQTLNKCKLLNVKPTLLKKLYDIDTASDLKKWRAKK